jgi:hypothetical protein
VSHAHFIKHFPYTSKTTEASKNQTANTQSAVPMILNRTSKQDA